MTIIKEYAANRVALRTSTYNCSLDYFDTLYEEAKKDFPELNKEDVSIVKYGGERCNHMYGIEFVTVGAPTGYTERKKLEPLL